MLSISRLIIGVIFILAGFLFFILSFYEVWWMVFYGIPLLIIGIVILLNKNEDEIEKRKDIKDRISKK